MPWFSIRKHQFTKVFAQVQPQRHIMVIAVVIQGNWATPQGDSKTHHHLGVHVFPDMQNSRVTKSQTWIKVSEIQWSQEVCDSVFSYMSSQVGCMNLWRQNLFQWRPQDVEGTKMSTETSWRCREELDHERGHICCRQQYWRDGTQTDTTAILDHRAAGFGLVPLGFSLTLVSSFYAISPFFLCGMGTFISEQLEVCIFFYTMDFWTVFKL